MANRFSASDPWDALIGPAGAASSDYSPQLGADGAEVKENNASSNLNRGGLLRSSYEPVPSLDTLKRGFDARRARNTKRMFEVLMQVYPDMDHSEARKLAMKF